MKKISSFLKVNTTGTLSPFGTYLDHCDDGGSMTIPQKYKDEEIDGDVLLLITIKEIPDSTFIAYAGACILGKEII